MQYEYLKGNNTYIASLLDIVPDEEEDFEYDGRYSIGSAIFNDNGSCDSNGAEEPDVAIFENILTALPYDIVLDEMMEAQFQLWADTSTTTAKDIMKDIIKALEASNFSFTYNTWFND